MANLTKNKEVTITAITSFERGWSQLRKCDEKKCRLELMGVLNVISAPSFYAYMKGKIEPKVSQYLAIEEIFHKYGVTDIWGQPDTKNE